MKPFFQILQYIKPFRRFAVLNLISNFLSVFFSLLSFTMLIPFLGVLFGSIKMISAPPEWNFTIDAAVGNLQYYFSRMIMQNGEMYTLLMICIGVVVSYFFKTSFFYLALYFMAPIRSGVVRNVRNELYEKILVLPLSYYSEQRKGDILSRASNDVQQLELSVMNSLQIFLREPMNILLFLLVLFLMSAQLTLFVLILLPITGFIIGKIAKTLRRKSQRAQEQLSGLLSMIEESISGLRIVKAFNAIWWADDRFNEKNREYTKTQISIYRRGDLASPMSEFLGTIVVILILIFGGQLVLGEDSSLQAEVFITYLVLFSQVITPAKSISTAYSNIQKGVISARRIQEVLNAEEVITESSSPRKVKDFNSSICFVDVSFAYEEEEVLKDIRLEFKKGKLIAIVGPSGAGKSTLVDLIPRFYDCTKGRILLDGLDIKEYIIDDLRSLTGIVNQDTLLFNDTVMYNIAFGMSSASENEVKEAARIANAHEFIMEMPQQYYAKIGDMGKNLSGGQRQRIAIARAVLKNPPILIMDEATSSLDTESERLVQDALTKLMENRTSIVIAHRLSTVMHADEIIVLDKGRIVERGHHEELIINKGLYEKLTRMQMY